jgi:uncharacterized membrane protein
MLKSETERNGTMKIVARPELEIEWSQVPVKALSRKWQLALFGLAHILILAVLFQTVYKIEFSGIGLYFDYASQALGGSLPYRDFALEYPPFSLLFFILPRLLGSTWQTFAIYYQAEVIIFDLIGLLVIYAVANRLGKSPWQMLSVYTLAILALGPITGQQYDIFPAIISLAAVYFLGLGKHKTAWALLALGALTKIYPAAIAPVFLIYYIQKRQYRPLRSGILTLAVVSLVVLLPFLITDPASLGSLYNYHGHRGIQLESTYSSFLLLGNQLGWLEVGTGFSFGSWNLVGPVADTVAKISVLLLPLSLTAAYWLIYRRMKEASNPLHEIAHYSLLVVAVMIATSKVLSPQYFIWLCPLVPLFSGRFRYALWAIFIAIGALTYYIFPLHYQELIDLKSGAIAALLARNLLVIAIIPLLIVLQHHIRRSEPSEVE